MCPSQLYLLAGSGQSVRPQSWSLSYVDDVLNEWALVSEKATSAPVSSLVLSMGGCGLVLLYAKVADAQVPHKNVLFVEIRSRNPHTSTLRLTPLTLVTCDV